MDGTISMVVSDHSPCTADLKLCEKGDFMAAWGGISGLQFGMLESSSVIGLCKISALQIVTHLGPRK